MSAAAALPESEQQAAPEAGTSLPADVLSRRAVETCIDNLIVSNHALGFRLGEGKPPADAEAAEGIRHFGPGPSFEVWLFWRAVERLKAASDAWRGVVTPPAPKAEAPEAPARLF